MKRVISFLLCAVLLLQPMALAAEATIPNKIISTSKTPAMASPQPDWRYTSGQKHTPLPITEKYYYSFMTEPQKAFYRQLDTAARNLEGSLQIPSNITIDEAYDIYDKYILDNPELFYLAYGAYSYSNPNGTSYWNIAYAAGTDLYCNTIYAGDSPIEDVLEALYPKISKFNADIESIISSIPSSAPDIVKESMIYSKLLRNAYYNFSVGLNPGKYWNGINEDNFSAYGVISNGYGVCESYAAAFQALCHAVGINCIGVEGYAGGNHQWNAVKIDGEWYQVDITFDDPVGGGAEDASHNYFNLTNQEMLEENHTWETQDYPICNTTKYGHDNFIATYGPERDGTLHYFTADCDTTCENCSYSRFFYEDNHDYSDAYDATCNTCGFRRNMGWIYEENSWYYYIDGKRVTNKWVKDSKGWCYLLEYGNGQLATNGIYTDYTGKSFYADADGHCAMNSWVYHYGSWYFADQSGYLVTNQWLLWKGKWYYLEENGSMSSDTWKSDSKSEVYLGTDGSMQTNKWIWVSYIPAWYYVGADGYKVKNKWVKDSKGWLYLGADGQITTNKWVKDSKGWCYVGYDGYCVTNQWKQDSTGKWCYLDANGNMVTNNWVFESFWYENSWEFYSNCWFYMDANGYRVTGTKNINGETHVFNKYGVWLKEV